MARSTLDKVLDTFNMLNRDSHLRHQSFLAQHIRALLALIRRIFGSASLVDTPSSSATAQNTASSSRRLQDMIPPGSWDSHMHVVDPANYPLAHDALYRPRTYTLDQALSFEASVALRNLVLVQPSIYGNDNSCMLDALRALGPQRGRAVVGFEPQTVSPETLCEWHALGVRGVRVNFSSVGRSMDQRELRDLLHRYARDCRPLGWVVQVYMPMAMVALLEPVVPELGVRVCVDHMGHPALDGDDARSPYDIPGFASLVRLLRGGRTFVKLSAPYRLSSEDDYSDVRPAAREMLRVAGRTRVVFATDWPHTRFEGLDIRGWVDMVLDECRDDPVLLERLFRGNAEDLWDVQS